MMMLKSDAKFSLHLLNLVLNLTDAILFLRWYVVKARVFVFQYPRAQNRIYAILAPVHDAVIHLLEQYLALDATDLARHHLLRD